MKTLSTVLIVLFMTSFAHSHAHIKEPNVSGQFYTGDPRRLSQEIDAFFAKATIVPTEKKVEMIMAPHAGYMYSGGVAAYSFKSVSQRKYSTIVILAPSHFYSFDGASVWAEGALKTPLGTIPVDEEFSRKLITLNPKFAFNKEVFEREHSLEVELPFLQKTFQDFKIVPIIMGQPEYKTCQALASALNQMIAQREDVLVVVSTDLSHYHPGEVARKMDHNTLLAVNILDAETIWKQCRLGTMEMCGSIPVTTALLLAKGRGLKAEILKYAHSGDITGDTARVVGYSAVMFYRDIPASPIARQSQDQEVSTLTSEHKKRLLKIARETVEAYVRSRKIPAFKETDSRLLNEEGAFVTLHKHGQLRGCIGNVLGKGPLYKTVIEMAIAAATQDPRFKPVVVEELNEIDLDISVLSIPRLAKSIDEIEMGKHGVIISQGPYQRGLFLPQVATETGWSREEFLSQLCSQKAGLPSNCWRDPSVSIEIFTAEVFAEKDFQ